MYVYIISNEAFDGWLKVGKTKDIKRRMTTMQTGAPTPYVVELLVELHDDKPVHNRLASMRIKRTGEWFQIELAELRDTVLKVKRDWAEWNPEPDSLPSDPAAANDGDHGWHVPARSPKLAVSQ
jgi:hypothetical protein